ncbi:MAG: putative sulfate exporter family transporter [Pseudomonadota bacterium]
MIPWFAFGFMAMVVFNSLVHLPATLHDGLVLAGQVALTMAMAALGYETRLEKLRSLGLRPFILALTLLVMLLTGGFLASRLLMG